MALADMVAAARRDLWVDGVASGAGGLEALQSMAAHAVRLASTSARPADDVYALGALLATLLYGTAVARSVLDAARRGGLVLPDGAQRVLSAAAAEAGVTVSEPAMLLLRCLLQKKAAFKAAAVCAEHQASQVLPPGVHCPVCFWNSNVLVLERVRIQPDNPVKARPDTWAGMKALLATYRDANACHH